MAWCGQTCMMVNTLGAQVLYEKQCTQLSDIIEIINGELSPNDRKKLITLCTVDVHARDVVQRLADDKAESAACFQWQSQLRYVYNSRMQDMQVHDGGMGPQCPEGSMH